uniref:Uncharacterized protein n=1 Tax=Talaromyces marneffei PM1 TaxID=1077442 RepID=A0A093UUI3_TALMA
MAPTHGDIISDTPSKGASGSSSFKSLVERSITAWDSLAYYEDPKEKQREFDRASSGLRRLRRSFSQQDTFMKWEPDRLEEYILLPVTPGFVNKQDCFFVLYEVAEFVLSCFPLWNNPTPDIAPFVLDVLAMTKIGVTQVVRRRGYHCMNDSDSRVIGWLEILVIVFKIAISELLYKVLQDDQTAGFRSCDVVTHEGDEQQPPCKQLNSISEIFRQYRIAKRQDGRLVLYGHAALYRAKRALGRTMDPSVTPSAADLITELIDVGHAEGRLLGPTGSELRGRVQSIGSELNDIGGKILMLHAHETVRNTLGATCARGLEFVWDGVGDWLG